MTGEKITEKMTFKQRPKEVRHEPRVPVGKTLWTEDMPGQRPWGRKVEEQKGSQSGCNGPARGAPVGREVRGVGRRAPRYAGSWTTKKTSVFSE